MANGSTTEKTGSKSSLSVSAFTLLELLIVTTIIISLLGIGINSLKTMSNQMSQIYVASDTRQLISSTIQEARRNQMPMVIKFQTGTSQNGDGNGDYFITGSQNSLIGFWSFDTTPANKGINRLDLTSVPVLVTGLLGNAAHFSGSTTLRTPSTYLLNCNSDFYFECQLRVNLNNLSNSALPEIFNGGSSGSPTKAVILGFDNRLGYNHLTATGIGPTTIVAPYPEDGQWHKVGLCKIQDLGVYIYLDDLLVAHTRVSSGPSQVEHLLEFGRNFDGDMDDIRFFRLGSGQTIEVSAHGAHFGFEAENPANDNKQYTMYISPFGVVNNVYRNDLDQGLFQNNTYVHLQMGWSCTIDLGGMAINTTPGAGAGSVMAINHRIRSRDAQFPPRGYAWLQGSTPEASEIVRYEIRDDSSSQRLRVTAANQLGTNGQGLLGSGILKLNFVDPVTVTHMGDVL